MHAHANVTGNMKDELGSARMQDSICTSVCGASLRRAMILQYLACVVSMPDKTCTNFIQRGRGLCFRVVRAGLNSPFSSSGV